jgi:hypothetical protein
MSHDHPRLELLKRQASEIGLSRDQVREFGSLSRRATWESAIAFYQATNREPDRWNDLENVDNVIHSQEVESPDTRLSNILSFPQLVTLFFLMVGFLCWWFQFFSGLICSRKSKSQSKLEINK